MSRLYCDYIKVDPNFIPVFSKNSDRIYPNKWQSFYPHESFKQILKETVDTLEKSSESKDHSLWMNGAYGTGKTYASFVIKHILEDDLANVEPYFVENKMMDLFARVKGIRAKGQILVIQRSASAGLNSQNKLFSAIVESVKDSLQAAGLTYTGSASMLDKVLTTLKDPNSAFNFAGAFQKYRAKFTEYATAQSVIRDLEELDLDDKLDLLDTIIDVADKEGYNWSMSPEEVINWLEDVRKGNQLYAMLFIWDEFTEYFKNNQNNITGLQEIAMADSRISFYFFLITHSSLTQVIKDPDSRRVLEARFKMSQIGLEERTAFKLLGYALHHDPDLKSEWDHRCEELWDGVSKGAVSVIRAKDITIADDDFRKLLPMHPYAAYLLRIIAKDISSNERTIFKFLSEDVSDDKHPNFKWFIQHVSFEYGKWNYLTADYLWDYFFNANNVDLDSAFTTTISHYNNFASMCQNDNQRRVLKVTLLLAALQAKNSADSRSGATSLMRPTLVNIKACFAGTPIESSVEDALNYFDSKGIMGKVEANRETLYVMTSAAIDEERMRQCLEDTKKTITFEKMISEGAYKVTEQFLPTDFLKMRMKIYPVSPVNAKNEAQNADQTPNHIPVFYLYAQNETQQQKIKDTVKTIYSIVGNKCVIVDFSASPFTDVLFDKFISSKAKEKYYSSLPNQKPQFDLAKKISADILNEWLRKLITTSLTIYTAEDKSTQRTGGGNLRKELKEINAGIYPYGLEAINQNDKLFAESGFKETVAQMAMGKITVPANYAYLRNISSRFEQEGTWGDPKYYENKPNCVISQMKLAINAVIDKAFNDTTAVSITDVWKVLQKAPFGLMANTGSVFLMGFLLQEFADSTYYKRDVNNNTVSLNYTDLSELIYGVIKGLPKANGQFIVKQTPEQAAFCQITGEIFKIAKDKRLSIDDIAKNINIYLTNNNYPLWSIKSYIEEELYEHEYREPMIQLADLLCEFVKPESKIGRERVNVVKDIYDIYMQYRGIDGAFAECLTIENMRTGMEYYIAQYKPELTQIASNLKIEPKEYLEMLNKKLSADSSYLWQLGDTNHQIDNLYTDLKLIFDINRLLSTKQRTYEDARKALVEKLNSIKIPNSWILEQRPELKSIMSLLLSIKNNSTINKAEASSLIANMADEFLAFFNSQYEVFSAALRQAISGPILDDEMEHLFNNTPSETLFKTTDEFLILMQRELEKYRKNKKTRKMHEAWEKATDSKTPNAWSTVHGIPILCMFTDDSIRAQRVFDALNGTSYLPNEQSIDDAIEFIQSDKLKILNDTKACEKAFIDVFCGDYAYVIDSVDDLRDRVRAVAGIKVYDWYARRQQCRQAIITFAQERYAMKYRADAKKKINSMSAEEAQAKLKELIENDPLFGIRILKG
ncbi:MAG: hypothetical protein E7320_01680 [Clostridiales bacterium]|nr:hypothetical protein [Clostridiales bacterium]